MTVSTLLTFLLCRAWRCVHPIKPKVITLMSKGRHPFIGPQVGILFPAFADDEETFAFTMCNPPFFESMAVSRDHRLPGRVGAVGRGPGDLD